jgi:glycerol-1-phosphate dehydrogenase [NAD(P)+]
MNVDELIAKALSSASDTKFLRCATGARHEVAEIFNRPDLFRGQPAVLVADETTYAAAGLDVFDSFRRSGVIVAEPFLFGPDVYADDRCVQQLQSALQNVPGIPVAVGAGTINDLTKLVAHRLGRRYLSVATAASMDGYTAYGASITYKGSKQTFDCPAPLAVVADLETIAEAPAGLNASGYADLLAKIAAGADWIVADAAGIEPINEAVWSSVQGSLHDWVSLPEGIVQSDPVALRNLVNGLMMSGFGMQAARTSRPASGADHQFSHLWDMQHHTHNGVAPSHGFKVGIGTLASTALYEELFRRGLGDRTIDDLIQCVPHPEWLEVKVREYFGRPTDLAEKAVEETLAKFADRGQLLEQLERLRRAWPQLVLRLQKQLIPFREMQEMLRKAGCPFEPEQIGISRERLKVSYRQAFCIRRRFTVLDLAYLFGQFDPALDALFSPGGAWGTRSSQS